ncbi:MAG TPA: metalloregulator ArsR/SmtB family transcription factor [Candidatus Omnitrophota bacterium]|nr:metalloregulator ArsR/SmtB family transcription factor [Candidatus Omnitrophota bacterium]
MDGNDFVRIFKALADKTRQDILELLVGEEMNVTDICSEFGVSQPTVSHHLQILRNCKLVGYRKEGKNIYYYARQDVVVDVFGDFSRRMKIKIVKK